MFVLGHLLLCLLLMRTLTLQISTVAQFLTMDWGMELCTINLSLPLLSDEVTELAALSIGADVSVWALEAVNELDPKVVTYSNKPSRRALLGNWTLTSGMNLATDAFPCPHQTYVTVEVGCAAWTNCEIDVRHVGTSPAGASIFDRLHAQGH